MTYSFLALGDSYTIGEGVPLYENFPYQTVQLLRKAGRRVAAPEILARTGWTTDELLAAFDRTQWLSRYDLVSLLIGVNNQYRGRGLAEYGLQFEELLRKIIHLSGQAEVMESVSGKPLPIFVFSIPDWSLSPFAHTLQFNAEKRSLADIAGEIDAFNGLALKITRQYGIPFIDITTQGRTGDSSPMLFTTDGLHPSAGQYHSWAELLAGAIGKTLDNENAG
jgi:lysophospholipase L1-like esterase